MSAPTKTADEYYQMWMDDPTDVAAVGRLHQLAKMGEEAQVTHDGLPCPGTCLVLANELEEERGKRGECECCGETKPLLRGLCHSCTRTYFEDAERDKELCKIALEDKKRLLGSCETALEKEWGKHPIEHINSVYCTSHPKQQLLYKVNKKGDVSVQPCPECVKKSEYKCEAFIPTHLARCPKCKWFPGGLPDGTIYCSCGSFTKEQWIERAGLKDRESTITPAEVQFVLDKPADPEFKESLRKAFRTLLDNVLLQSSNVDISEPTKMGLCSRCGSIVSDDETVCVGCGAKFG